MQRGSMRRRSFRRRGAQCKCARTASPSSCCTKSRAARATPAGKLRFAHPAPACHSGDIHRKTPIGSGRSGETDETAIRGRCCQSCVSDHCARVCADGADDGSRCVNRHGARPRDQARHVSCDDAKPEGTGQARPDAALHGAGTGRLPEAGDRSEGCRRAQEEFHQDLPGRRWHGAATVACRWPHGCGFSAPGKCRCSTAAGVA